MIWQNPDLKFPKYFEQVKPEKKFFQKILFMLLLLHNQFSSGKFSKYGRQEECVTFFRYP